MYYNAALNYGSGNVNFQSRSKIANFFRNMGKSSKPVTQAHLDNMFYKTNLNEILRNPEAAKFSVLDSMSYSAMQMSAVHGLDAQTRFMLPRNANIKDRITEDPIVLKNRFNKEFERLKPTKEKLNLYRGMSNISDKEYERFKSYKQGSIQIPDDGFSYMSRDLEEAKGYAVGPLCGRNPVMFEVEIPPASRISELEGILPPSPTSPDWPLPRIKHELVTPAGSYYEVVKDSEVDKDGVLHVFLKYLNRW